MKSRRWSAGAFLLAVGIAASVGLWAYGQVRFPVTNYTSTIDVDAPLAYYEHELRAGDTLFLALAIEGGPLDLRIAREGDPSPPLIAPGLQGTLEIRFDVPATGTYDVIFEPSCASCVPASLRAQVSQSLGGVGPLPTAWGATLGALGAMVGGSLLASARRRRA